MRNAFIACCAAIALCLAATEPAFAQSVVERDLGEIAPGAPIELTLEAPAAAGTLAAEIDGVDVTDLLRVAGRSLSVAAAAPLSAGPHLLTLYREADGAFETIGTYAFSIGGPDASGAAEEELFTPEEGGPIEEGFLDDGEAAQEAEQAEAGFVEEEGALAQGHDAGVDEDESEGADGAEDGAPWRLSHTGMGEVNRRSINDHLGEMNAQHGGELTLTFEEDRLTAEVDWLATTDKISRNDPDSAVDIGAYKLASRERVGAFDVLTRLGDQGVAYDGAVLSSMTRRGFSVEAESLDYGVGLAAFALRGSSSLGSDNFTGLDQGDDQIYGGKLSWSPFLDETMTFTLAGYTGRGGEFDLVSEGHGFSAGVGGFLFEGATEYNAQLGFTDLDPDANDDAVQGDAALGARFTLNQRLWEGEDGEEWTATGGYERTETAFETLGASELTPGQEIYSLSTDFSLPRWRLGGSASRAESNIGGPSDLETDRTFTLGGSLGFTPYAEGYRNWAWAEGLTLSADYTFTTVDRLESPIGLEDADSTTHNARLALGSTLTPFGWSLGYAYDAYNDEGIDDLDVNTHTLDASVTYTPHDRLSLTLGPFLANYYDRTNLPSNYDFSAGMSASAVLWPDLLSASLSGNYQTNDDKTAVGPRDGRSVTGGLALTPFEGRPIGFHLDGGYSDGALAQDLEETDDEWFASFTIRADTDFVTSFGE